MTAALFALPAGAQEYKIGISAGLTGYAATLDRGWRDGVEIAAATLNAKGGIMGRKLEVVVEDNRSEPQEAVTVYRKMISSDNVNVFISGCVSAGNFAAAGLVVRAQLPMVLCSILPQQPDHVKWAFSTLPPASFEVEKRFEYLKDKTQIRKIGVLHDPTPYAGLQKAAAETARRELRPRDRRHRAVQAGRRRSQRPDQQDERRRRARHPQDRPRRHDLDRGQEHQAARPRHDHAHQRRGPRRVPPGGGGARRQVLLRRLAVTDL